jgi:hypothetical protein
MHSVISGINRPRVILKLFSKEKLFWKQNFIWTFKFSSYRTENTVRVLEKVNRLMSYPTVAVWCVQATRTNRLCVCVENAEFFAHFSLTDKKIKGIVLLYAAGQEWGRSTTALTLRRHARHFTIPLALTARKARFTTDISHTHRNN